MNMKKLTTGLLTVFLLAAAVTGAVFVRGSKPLSSYNFNNCSVSVFNYDHSEILCELTNTQSEELTDTLKNIEITAYTPEADTLLSGMHYAYEFSLSNGKAIKISTTGNYLIIDGKIYECDQTSLLPFTKYAEEAFRVHYPVA